MRAKNVTSHVFQAGSFIAIVAALAPVSSAMEIEVPGDAPTIQAAFDQANDGDVILVDEGVYRENVTMRNKMVSIRSTGCPQRTIIDGGGTGSAVRIDFPGAILEGLKVTGGIADRGGGIEIARTIPGQPVEVQLARIIVEGNEARNSGGGIAATADPGGPIILRMANCLVDGNRAGRGGAIFLDGGSVGVVDVLIVNCTLARNGADSDGAGLAVDGAVVGMPDAPMAFNSIFWDNRLRSGAPSDLSGLGPGTVRTSDIGDGQLVGLDGNLREDPRFHDPARGDYRLLPGSPCLDAGVPGFGPATSPGRDFNGALYFDDPDVPNLNGGYEPCGIVDGDGSFIRGDATGDGVLDISDPIYTFDYLFLSTRYRPCVATMDANDDGVVDITDGIYSLDFLYLGGPLYPPPYPFSGRDPEGHEDKPKLPCDMYPACWPAP
jgi:predicted outer membrane repeat protein